MAPARPRTAGRPAPAARRAAQHPGRAALARRPGGDLDGALEMAGAARALLAPGPPPGGPRGLVPPAGGGRGSPSSRARALQAVSLVERPRACLVHPSPRCAETAGRAWPSSRTSATSPAPPCPASCSPSRASPAPTRRARHLLCRGRGPVRAPTATPGAKRSSASCAWRPRSRPGTRRASPIGRATAATFRQLDDPWGLSAILYHLGWGCGSSAATKKRHVSWRRRSTWPPAPGSTTLSSGRWPTSASASSTRAPELPASSSTARAPPRNTSATGPARSWPPTVGLLAQVAGDGPWRATSSPRRCPASSASDPGAPRAVTGGPARATKPTAMSAAPGQATRAPSTWGAPSENPVWSPRLSRVSLGLPVPRAISLRLSGWLAKPLRSGRHPPGPRHPTNAATCARLT